MNKTYTISELISLDASNEEFLSNIKDLMRTAPIGQDITELRRMLYSVELITKETRAILDQYYVDSISTEQLLKDIQRTAV